MEFAMVSLMIFMLASQTIGIKLLGKPVVQDPPEYFIEGSGLGLGEDPFDIIVYEPGAVHVHSDTKSDQSIWYFEDAGVNKCGRVFKDGQFVADHLYEGCRMNHLTECEGMSPGAAHTSTVVSLTVVWPGAYYHVVVESLTRVSLVFKSNPSLLNTAYFHLGTTANWALQWAEMIGITREKVIGHEIAFAPVVVFPQSNYCGSIRPAFATETRRKLQNRIQNNITKSAPRRAVLIKRRSTRILQNHDQVCSLLRSFNYVVNEHVEGSEGSVGSQCLRFAQADLVVGPHGAALSNLLCVKAGAPVIEFQEAPHNGCFNNLCYALGLHYIGIPTDMDRWGKANISLHALRDALERV